MLTHTIGEPHAYGCPPEIMERSLFDTRFSGNDIKLSFKVVYHLKPGFCQCPLALWPHYVLDVVITCCGDKNIRMPFRLLSLVIYEHLNDFLCYPPVGLHPAFPSK